METKDRTVTVAVITGIVTLLLGCCLGVLVGGVGGYLIGQRVSQGIERTAPIPSQLPSLPTPRMTGINGAIVREVISGTPAEQAGLKVGDIITAVDNIPIDQNHALADVLSQYKPGDQVTLEVQRAGSVDALKVTLGENPDNPGKSYLGVYYSDFPMLRSTPNPGD